MGCCLSIQHEEEEQQNSERHVNKPKVIPTLHSQAIEKGSSVNSLPHTTTTTAINIGKNKQEEKWPILVRLSNNGQDIAMGVPIRAPYTSVAELGKALLPHLEKNCRVKFIYLGRILPDQQLIVPQSDDDLPPTNINNAIHVQKEGVIQAMVTHQ